MPFMIYALVDPRTLLVGYVGASSRGRKRGRSHWSPSSLRDERNQAKKQWLQEILKTSTPIVNVLEVLSVQEELPEAEKRWISLLLEQGHPLTNISPGGNGFVGYKHAVETCDKMSASHLARDRSPQELEQAAALGRSWKGKTRSPETRAKMSAAKQGKPRSPETVEKVAAALRGRPLAPETRAKISTALSGITRSPETRARMAEAKRRYWTERKAAPVP